MKLEKSTPLSYVGSTPDSPWTTYLSQVDRVLPYLGPLAKWAETLKRPKRALIVDVPIEMDNGTVRHFEGYRVQHNLSRGPGKGGIRFHPDVTLEEVMALSAWMTVKTAGVGLPFVQGGDSGGALFMGNVLDATSPLWGITSAQIYDEDANGQATNYRSGFVDIASYRSWIDATMSADLADDQMFNWVITAVPEPSSVGLLALGLGLVAWRARRRVS